MPATTLGVMAPLPASVSSLTASMESAPPNDGYLGQEVGKFGEQVGGISTSVATVVSILCIRGLLLHPLQALWQSVPRYSS